MMFKSLVLSLATIATLSGAVVATSSSAEARGMGRHNGHGVRGYHGRGFHMGHFRRPNCHWRAIYHHHHWVDVRVCHPNW